MVYFFVVKTTCRDTASQEEELTVTLASGSSRYFPRSGQLLVILTWLSENACMSRAMVCAVCLFLVVQAIQYKLNFNCSKQATGLF